VALTRGEIPSRLHQKQRDVQESLRTVETLAGDTFNKRMTLNEHVPDGREVFPASHRLGAMMGKIGRERGWSGITRQQYDASHTLRGSDFIGNPDEIIEKILFQHNIFDHQRLLLQLGVGTIAHAKVMRAIELLGTRVAPVVREEIRKRM